jgi:hypothetical protein
VFLAPLARRLTVEAAHKKRHGIRRPLKVIPEFANQIAIGDGKPTVEERIESPVAAEMPDCAWFLAWMQRDRPWGLCTPEVRLIPCTTLEVPEARKPMMFVQLDQEAISFILLGDPMTKRKDLN